MAKQYNIRWRDSDNEELRRVVKNFNAKISRIEKNKPEWAVYQPDRVSMKDIKSNITTRKDLKKAVKSLSDYTKRGAEAPVKSTRGAKATEWEVKEYKKKARQVNRERAKERQKILDTEVTTRGEGTGVTRAQMGSIKDNALKPINSSFKNKSQKEWELKKELIDKSLDETWKTFRKSSMRINYIKGLTDAGFYDAADLVRKMDVDEFISVVETDAEASFEFIYDPIEWEAKNEALRQTWENALNKIKK